MSDRLREALTWIDAMQADLRTVYPNGKTPPGGPDLTEEET